MRHKSIIKALGPASCVLALLAALTACNPDTLIQASKLTQNAATRQTVFSPTPLRYPTLPPEWTATWTPTPTLTRPTAAVTNTPSAMPYTATEAAPAATLGTPAAPTACDHPWLPLRQGARWNYQRPDGRLTWTVTEVSGDLNHATATVVVKFPKSTSIFHFVCDAEGLKVYDYDYTVFDPTGKQIIPDVLASDGVWLPPASVLDTVQLFARWTETFSVAYDPRRGMTRDAIYTDEVDAISSTVSVPAGKFDAIDVNWDSRGRTTRTGQQSGDEQANFGNLYFVRGIGIVLFNWPPDDTNTAKLVSYSLP